jgi:hypothetical protein
LTLPVLFRHEKEAKMKNQHHLVQNPRGGWDVKRAGAGRVSVYAQTKQDAEAIGRAISRNQGTEFVIHGKIQQSDSRGHDPFPSRG